MISKYTNEYHIPRRTNAQTNTLNQKEQIHRQSTANQRRENTQPYTLTYYTLPNLKAELYSTNDTGFVRESESRRPLKCRSLVVPFNGIAPRWFIQMVHEVLSPGLFSFTVGARIYRISLISFSRFVHED